MTPRLRIAIVLFAIFSATFANNGIGSIYVIFEQRFGFSPLSVTAIFATYAIAVLVALLCVGRLSDDIGRRPLLLVGSSLLIVSTIIFLEASGTASLYVARAFQGLATGTIASTGAAAIVDLEPDHDRNRASLLTTVAFLTGAAFGPLFFGVTAQYLPRPLTTPFLIELALQMVGTAALLALAEPATHTLTGFRWRVQRPSVPVVMRRSFAVAGIVITTGWMVGGLYNSLSGSMDRQLLGVRSHALTGGMLFLFSAIGGASQLVFSSALPRRTMTIGMCGTAIGIALVEAAIAAVSAPLFVLATVVTGAGAGLTFSGSLALVNALAPHHMRAEILSAYNVVGYLSLSVPVVGVGVLVNHIGLKSATLVFASVTIALSVYALIALRDIPVVPYALEDPEVPAPTAA